MTATSTLRTTGLALLLVCSAIVAPIGTWSSASAQSGPPSTDVRVSNASEDLNLDAGEEQTVDIVVPDAEGGVGSFDLSLEVANDSVASITDVEFPESLNASITNDPDVDDSGDVDVRAAGADTADTGRVVLVRVTVRGERGGSTDLQLRAQTVGTEDGEPYTITGSPDRSIVVEGGEPSGGNQRPEVTATVDADGSTENGLIGPVTVSINATDPDGSVERIEYEVDGGGFTSEAGNNASVRVRGEGSHTVRYRAVDNDGDESFTESESFQIDVSGNPIESFEATGSATGLEAVEATVVTSERFDELVISLSRNGEIVHNLSKRRIDDELVGSDRTRYTATFLRAEPGRDYGVTLERATTGTRNWASGRTRSVSLTRRTVQLELRPARMTVVEGQPLRFRVRRASDGFGIRNANISTDGTTVRTRDDSVAFYTFSEPGTYEVEVTKQPDDEFRYRSDTVEIEVVRETGPTVDNELAGPWASFQGGRGRTGVPTAGDYGVLAGGDGIGPEDIAAVQDPTKAWSSFLEPPRRASPVTVGGIVYAAAVSVDGPQIVAFDAATGDRVWTWTASVGDGNGERAVVSSPVVMREIYTDRPTVYIADTEGIFYAVDARNGSLRWRKDLSGAPDRSPGEIKEEFAIVNGIAYVPVDGGEPDRSDSTERDALVALNLETQQVLWRYRTGHIGGVSAAGESIYVTAGEDEMLVRFQDDVDKVRRWRYTKPTENDLPRGEKVIGAPTVKDGTAYIRNEDAEVFAVGTEEGQTEWGPVRVPGRPADLSQGDVDPTSMAIADGRLIVAQGDSGEVSYLTALDSDTGAMEWNVSRNEDFRSPVILDETVYVPTERGTLFAFDIRTGDQQWKYETTDIGFQSGSVAVADGMLFFQGSDTSLHAVTETPTEGVLTGTVRSENGTPVSDATVRVAPPMPVDRLDNRSTIKTVTGSDGRFRLQVPIVGSSETYRLRVEVAGAERYAESVVVEAGGKARVNASVNASFSRSPSASAVSVAATPSETQTRVGQVVTYEIKITADGESSQAPREGIVVDANSPTSTVRILGPLRNETNSNGIASFTAVPVDTGDASLRFALPGRNRQANASLTAVEAPNQPPNATVVYAPSSPTVGQTVSVTARRSTDPDGRIRSYNWTFDGPTAPAPSEAALGVTARRYTEPGQYDIRLTITDDDGATTTTTRTIVINPNNSSPNGDAEDPVGNKTTEETSTPGPNGPDFEEIVEVLDSLLDPIRNIVRSVSDAAAEPISRIRAIVSDNLRSFI